MKQKEFELIKLKNGLRVLLVSKKESLTTTALVVVSAGSDYENKNINGISHFLEHMCFKGTKKRPNSMVIAEELDGLGAEYNAFTSNEYTSYYAKAKNEMAPRILEIVSDMYLNPIFNPDDIEREKGVIVEEINMYEDLPQRKVQELFMETIYGDQPAGRSIAGEKKVVRSLKREDFVLYRKNHYLPQSTIVVLSGGFSKKEVLKQINEYFKYMPEGKKNKKTKTKDVQKNPQEKIFFKKSDQTHLCLGFRAFGVSDKRQYALEVLTDILGGGMSSRLFNTVREKMGAAYYINAYTDLYTDHGYIAMSAGINNKKLYEVLRASLKEFALLKTELVSSKELKRAKEHLVGNIFLGLETSERIGYYYGIQEIMNRKPITPHELEKKIRAVTAKDIRDVARALFKNEKLNFSAVGPIKDRSLKKHLTIK